MLLADVNNEPVLHDELYVHIMYKMYIDLTVASSLCVIYVYITIQITSACHKILVTCRASVH